MRPADIFYALCSRPVGSVSLCLAKPLHPAPFTVSLSVFFSLPQPSMTTSSLGISSSCLLSAYSSDNLTASRLFPNFSPHCAVPLLLSRALWCLWCLHPLPLPCRRHYRHLFALFLISILFSQVGSIFSVPLPNTHFLFACWFSSLPYIILRDILITLTLFSNQLTSTLRKLVDHCLHIFGFYLSIA